MNKRIISAALSASMLIPCVATAATVNAAVLTDNAEVSATDYGLADNIQDGVILHCFDWKYTDITAELKNIAEAGFTSIQTSPVQANNNHGAWYWQYLPKGFYVDTTDLGTKAELATLCEEAEKYGIKVVVDVVANHLEGSHDNIDDSLKGYDCWHHTNYSSEPSNGQVGIDWSNRYQITFGEIGMADLATENSYVQGKVVDYLKELKSIGVDGIRWDAAKHIGLPSEGDNFWKVVTSSTDLYNYGEILDNPGGDAASVLKEYTQYISITDSGYGWNLRNAFSNGSVPTVSGCWTGDGISDSKIVYWSESHDTYSNGGSGSQYLSQNVIDRGYAVAAARVNASSLYFSRPYATDKESIKLGQKGSTHFTSAEVSEVNKFHNAMIGKTDYYAYQDNCAVVTRKGGGAVLVKGSGSGYVSVPNGGSYAKTGTYVDRISGNTFTVTSSTISGEIGSSGIAVIYEDENPSPKVSVTPGSSTYKTDTYSLTLNVKNADNGQYSINGGSYTTYTDGTKITIGSGLAYGTQTTVTVKASNANGSAEETYTYTKVDPTLTQKIYFDNSSYNWSNIYAYIYDGKTENAAWPGEKMTLDSSTGYYMVEVDDSLAEGAVIFSDGTNSADKRYPADMEPGLDLNGSTKLFTAGNKLVDYQPTTQPNTTQPTTTQPATTQPVTTPVGNVLIGDVDQDGSITISDVSEIQLHLAEMATLTGNNLIAADANGDGVVDIKDASLVQSYIVNISVSGSKVGTYTGGSQPTTTQPVTTQPTTTQPTTTQPVTTQPVTQPSTSSDKYTMTFTDNYNWGSVNCYYWSDSNTAMTSWPGVAMSKVDTNSYGQNIYSVEIPSDATYVIFNNGSSQTVDISITGSAKFYISGNSNGKYTVSNWT